MSPARRTVAVLLVLAAVAVVLLLVAHNALEGYARKRPPEGGVSGEVVFADGSPAAGASVVAGWTLEGTDSAVTTAVSDASGRFRAPAPPAPARPDTIDAGLGPLQAKASAAVGTGVRIVLPATFRLAGLVLREGDRAPVSGATLDVGGVRATTGSGGDFVLADVPAPALRDERAVVRVRAPGFAPLDWPLPRDLPPPAYGDLTLRLAPE